MSTTRTIASSVVVLALIASTGCRPRTEETRNEPTQAPGEAQPRPQAPPDPARPAEAVGTTETHGATAQPAKPAPAAPELPPFEGELAVDVQGKAPESLSYAMKGDKIRLGLSATPGRNDKGIDAIIDTDDKKARVLFKERKEYVEIDLGKLAEKAKERVENVEVEKTGATAVISGRTCEEWRIKDKDYRVDACVMKGAPWFDLDALEKQANIKTPAWMHRIVDAGYVPLRVSVSDPSGKSLGSSQIANTSKNVEASQFDVPVGYKKVDAAKMLPQK